jgi:transposase
MSWQTKSVMEQKLLFIKMLQSGNYTMTALCVRFNISRTTGHKLVKRFEQEGESCLRVKSKAPYTSPQKTPEEMELAIVKLRKSYPNWGARKIKVLLQEKHSKINIPSETTINAILKRNDLIIPKRRRNPKEGKLFPKFGVQITKVNLK